MIDVKQMANDDINELLEQTFETAVDEQGETFSKEVDKAVDEYHQRVERNNSTMIEPKSFLACAIV